MKGITREQARRLVQAAGLRVTAPRVAVLELLSKAQHPLSHRDVVESLGNTDWDRATLFRNLQKLVEVELLQIASRAGGITRYELKSEEQKATHVHPHFACKDCGTVSCLPDATFSAPTDLKWRQAVLEAEFQVVGRCPDCRTGRRHKPRAQRA